MTAVHRSQTGRPCQGFTLIELLVVVVIVGVLAGTIVLNVTDRGAQQRFDSDVASFVGVLELARAQALQRNREWGVVFDESSYRFVELSDEDGWVDAPGERFGERSLQEVQLHLSVEGREAKLIDTLGTSEDAESGDRDGTEPPDLVLFSSGETTPFELEFRPAGNLVPLRVSSDGLTLQQFEDADVASGFSA